MEIRGEKKYSNTNYHQLATNYHIQFLNNSWIIHGHLCRKKSSI